MCSGGTVHGQIYAGFFFFFQRKFIYRPVFGAFKVGLFKTINKRMLQTHIDDAEVSFPFVRRLKWTLHRTLEQKGRFITGQDQKPKHIDYSDLD